jgi:acetate kinase
MTDAIAVVNAGSSSIKFSLFAEQDGKLKLKARGQNEGIHTGPHFIAKDGAGALIADKSWSNGVKLGQYIAQALPKYDAKAARGKAIVLHLGNGASMCAISSGRSVASTMGFTAVDGLPMGTRCGNLDPGVMLYLLDELKMDTHSIAKLIYLQSGLLGVSGVSSDMRTLEASVEPDAQIAIELFAYRIGRELGSLAAALGGADAIVFTGGIGENSRSLREHVCKDAAWLGIDLDTAANQANASRISTPASRVAAWVIPTNEELMIARHTQALLSAPTGQRTVKSGVEHVQ